MKLSIIIPCHNEINTLEKIIDKVNLQNSYNKEIIVIDDYYGIQITHIVDPMDRLSMVGM